MLLNRENIENYYFYTIEVIDGEKTIHISYAYWISDEPHCEEYTFAYISVEDYLKQLEEGAKGFSIFTDIVTEVKIYASDETDESFQMRLDEENENIESGKTIVLDLSDINLDTPEGCYCGC